MPVLAAEGLTHIYSPATPFRSTALENVNIEIPQGQFVGVIGRTGSGKSTFVQHLNGLLSPTSGRVLFDGKDINASKKLRCSVRHRVGLVFQYPEHQLFEDTVRRDIAFGPKNMRLSASEVEERVLTAAGFAGVEPELMDRSPLELSGGQKRRVAIAGVIAMAPEVLILDEPTAGLDPDGCRCLLDNIAEYRRATGATVILVSHSMEDVSRLADRLVVFDRGRILMDAAPEEVFSQPELLRAHGLDVPAAGDIAMKLRSLGVPVPAGCLNVDCLSETLLSLWKEGRS